MRGIGLSILLALTLLMGMLPVPVSAAVTTPDIVVTIYDYTGKPLTTGEDFTLQGLTYKNVSGVELTNLSVDFSDASSTVMVTAGGSVVVPADQTLSINETGSLGNVPLRYVGDGTSKSIPVVFTYTKGGTATETTASIAFETAPTETSGPSTPVVTKDYKPILTTTVSGSNFTDGGQQNVLHVLVKNTSPSYPAKNVMVTLPESNTSPFTAASFGNSLPIAELAPNATVELVMNVTTDTYANAGAYKLPLHISYQNAWNDPFDTDTTLPLTVRNSNTPGLLVVEAGTPVPSISAGGTFSLPVTIRNQGSLPVNDVKINLDGLTADGFMLASGSSRLSFDRIDGNGAKTVTLQLRAGVALKAGSYPVGFKLEYSDARAVDKTDTQQIWVPVGGAGAADSNIEVMSITPSKTSVDPEGTVSVTVVVKNTGTTEAKQIKITGEVDATMFFPISQNLYILKSLKAGEEKKLTFSYQAQTEAKKGSTPVTVKVELPAVGTETPVTLTQAVSVFVNGSATGPDATKNVPKIIVYSYSADPGLVTAGSEFELNLSFMNTHASKTIHNIKANFTVNEASNETGSVFTPVGSSNTFYMDRITPKGTVERKLRLYTIPDAKSKTYNVTISFDYEDENGNPYKTDEIIGIPVYQPSRFEVNEPSFQTDTMVGQPMPLSFEMYNLGKTILYNVKVKVTCEPEGIMDVTPKSQYYGNYDPGKNEYVEVTLNPLMAGKVDGKILVTYETATGESQEATKEFSINVADMPPMPDNPGVVLGPDGKPLPLGPDGLPLPAESEKNLFQKIIGSIWGKIGIGVVVLGIVTFVVLRIRKKKQEKGLEF